MPRPRPTRTNGARRVVKTLPTKYASHEAASLVATLFDQAGLDAVVVPGSRYPEYRVRIYIHDATPQNREVK